MHKCFIWLDLKGFVHKRIIYAGYESDHDDRGHVWFSVKFNQNSEKRLKFSTDLCYFDTEMCGNMLDMLNFD